MSKKMKIIILVAVLAIAALTVTSFQMKFAVNDNTIVDTDHKAQ